MRDTDRDAGWMDFMKSGSPEDYLKYKGIVPGAESKGEAVRESDRDRDRDGAVSGAFRGL